jgi:hypothetical protein
METTFPGDKFISNVVLEITRSVIFKTCQSLNLKAVCARFLGSKLA